MKLAYHILNRISSSNFSFTFGDKVPMSQYSAQDIYSAKVLRYIESFSFLRMVLLTFIFMMVMEIEKLLVQDSSSLIDLEMYSYKREEIT